MLKRLLRGFWYILRKESYRLSLDRLLDETRYTRQLLEMDVVSKRLEWTKYEVLFNTNSHDNSDSKRQLYYISFALRDKKTKSIVMVWSNIHEVITFIEWIDAWK